MYINVHKYTNYLPNISKYNFPVRIQNKEKFWYVLLPYSCINNKKVTRFFLSYGYNNAHIFADYQLSISIQETPKYTAKTTKNPLFYKQNLAICYCHPPALSTKGDKIFSSYRYYNAHIFADYHPSISIPETPKYTAKISRNPLFSRQTLAICCYPTPASITKR